VAAFFGAAAAAALGFLAGGFFGVAAVDLAPLVASFTGGASSAAGTGSIFASALAGALFLAAVLLRCDDELDRRVAGSAAATYALSRRSMLDSGGYRYGLAERETSLSDRSESRSAVGNSVGTVPL
jgi:hypothetical protein